MNDEDLVESFELGTVGPMAFGHREHVRVAWIYLTRYERPEAEWRMLNGLRAFATRAGKPDRFDGPLTRAWMAAIADAMRAQPASFDELVAARPDLLDRASVRARSLTL